LRVHDFAVGPMYSLPLDRAQGLDQKLNLPLGIGDGQIGRHGVTACWNYFGGHV
jgi:hypothetical protein